MNSYGGTHSIDGDCWHKCNLWCEVESTVTHCSKEFVSLYSLSAVLNRVVVDFQHIGALQQPYRSFATTVSQFKIWHFFIYWCRKKRLQVHFFFNRYSVVRQFAKLAAGEQFCRYTHTKLQHFKTFKNFS